jgi:hypothetical protein
LNYHIGISYRHVIDRLVRRGYLPSSVIWDFGLALKLFRIESERFKLSTPFGRRIAEALDADAAGQAKCS